MAIIASSKVGFFWPTLQLSDVMSKRNPHISPMARAAPVAFFVYRIYIWESGVAWFPFRKSLLGCPDSSGLSLSRQRTTYSNLEAAQEISWQILSGDL